ncbi:hypothetical protein [Actomonas aquatica]|uniref:Uncharacterized protein n=1 Tax=Actomonas aquatica TaxID=2866162 RepID=A0ABZ1C7I3_9BACT|nr:hypothetical protein [Opitutus sp. WL0086]WRQ87362.1 hypothetical protein K1X11_021320 [Opitutus sp. WL0086]
MHDGFLRALQTQRPDLRQRWEALLRAERVSSPMAHPDTLVHLMDWTLDRLLDELRQPHFRRHSEHGAPRSAGLGCVCGKNPLLTYFSTAEQAVVETLLLDDTDLRQVSSEDRSTSLDELKAALHAVARREIDSFCAVCQSRVRHEQEHTAAVLKTAR